MPPLSPVPITTPADMTLTVAGVPIPMQSIPAGRFRRGDTTVTLSTPFWLMTTPLTQGQWKAIWGQAPPCRFVGDDLPVDSATWDQAVATAVRVGAACDGLWCGLPSEAQWEYACRAGGPADPPQPITDHAWTVDTSGRCTRPVARLRPNAWGLHDMLGNVWEWCRDWVGDLPAADTQDPEGPPMGVKRSVRGGSFSIPGHLCRADRRGGDPPDVRLTNIGFRLCLMPVAPPSPAAGQPTMPAP